MARFAFVTPPFLGHLNPMAALAGELVARGHRATFLHMADAGPLLAARGCDHQTVGSATHPAGHLSGVNRRIAAIEGVLGLRAVVRDVAAATDMLCRELPGAVRGMGADMIVCDQVEAAGGLVAYRLALPFVSVANALPINSEAQLPPIFTPWRYGASEWSRKRNLGGHAVSEWFLRPITDVIRHYAAAWSFGRLRRVTHCLSRVLQISQLVPGLDFPRARLPDHFHYCGPLRAPVRPDADFHLPDRDGRPLVYASLGSLQGSRVSLFRTIALAAERCGLQAVIAHGGGLTPDQAAGLPGSPATHAFVPQDLVLSEASIAVLNGGLNTVLDALARAVPIVVVPIAFEQGAIAARLEHAGAGMLASRRGLTAGRLARAMEGVMTGPTYRKATRGLQLEIERSGGVRRAADLVEAALESGKPVLREAPLASPGIP